MWSFNTLDRHDKISMVDYSSQKLNSKLDKYSEENNLENFKDFIIKTNPYDFDIVLEIKDKEKSVIKEVKLL